VNNALDFYITSFSGALRAKRLPELGKGLGEGLKGSRKASRVSPIHPNNTNGATERGFRAIYFLDAGRAHIWKD